MTVFLGILLLAAVAWGLAQCWQNRRLLQRLNAMLDDALQGQFCTQHYNEDLLSAVESRMAQLLAANELDRRELAAEKERVKSLIGDISHQTKTPTANLVLYTQLLVEQDLPPESRQLAQSAAAQAEKLRFLMQTLVKLSRLESGVITLHPTPAPLTPLLERAAGQVRTEAQHKGVSLIVSPCEETALYDEVWTAEALFNLLDNAVKYTPAGGTILLSVQPCELFCRVDVSDTGTGIPESEQAGIFARFARGSNATGVPGLGIGLALARQIAAGQGGYLRVRSSPGEGSVFSLYLPKN